MTPLPRTWKQPWYVSLPAVGSGPGVLLLHSGWGLDGTFREMADRLAAAGFAVVAPDLFHGRQARSSASSAVRAETTWRLLMRASEAALHYGSGERIGIVGCSMGGQWALWLAQQNLAPAAATVVFYAARTGDFRASRSAFQFHLADDDPFVSEAVVRQVQRNLAQASRPAEFHTYTGTAHWFIEPGRQSAYDPEAAGIAWERTLAFLGSRLGPQAERV